MTSVTIDGLPRLARKLEKLGGRNVHRRPMQKTVLHVQRHIAKYPPATAANVPPGVNGYSWYERGFGTRSVTGKAWATSETYGRRWTSEVKDGGRRGIVGNNASYAPYLGDETQQAAWAAARGWLTVQDVVRNERRDILDFWRVEYRRLLNE